MNSWKTAFQLNKWELKKSAINIVIAYLVTFIYILFFIRELPSYLENGTVLYDLLFLLVFGASPLFPKPKSFEVQINQNRFMASPIVVLQKHLPIKNDVIIYSRLIMHIFYTVPIQIAALLILYITTSLHNILSVGSFISFGIVWLSFSIYVGYLVPRLNIGAQGLWLNNSGFSVIFIVILTIFFFGLTMIHVVFDNGIVYWSIVFARDYPLVTGGVSILLAFVGFHFWRRKMRKVLGRLMYG